jgi:hypothetical protein
MVGAMAVAILKHLHSSNLLYLNGTNIVAYVPLRAVPLN